MKLLNIVGAILCLLALAPFPIGYYTFLRIAVTLAAGIIVYHEYPRGINFWVGAFGITVILFNPVIPVYMHSRAAWAPIDIIVALLFMIHGFATNSKKDKYE